MKRLLPIALVLLAGHLYAQGGFNGVESGLGNLYRLSPARSRSISPENFTGAREGSGKASSGTGSGPARDLGVGWKLSPSVVVPAGKTFTLAEM
jgi:hypothetical protein